MVNISFHHNKNALSTCDNLIKVERESHSVSGISSLNVLYYRSDSLNFRNISGVDTLDTLMLRQYNKVDLVTFEGPEQANRFLPYDILAISFRHLDSTHFKQDWLRPVSRGMLIVF
jgi:hypothetical protein